MSNLSFTLPTPLNVVLETPVPLPRNVIFSQALKENLKDGKYRYFIIRNNEEIYLQFTVGPDSEGTCLITPYIIVGSTLTLGGEIVLFEYSPLRTIEVLTPFSLLPGRNRIPLSFFSFSLEVLEELKKKNTISTDLFLSQNLNFQESRIFISLVSGEFLGIFNPSIVSINVNIHSVLYLRS